MLISKHFEDFDPDNPNAIFYKKRWEWWAALRKSHAEFESILNADQEFHGNFHQWMKDIYGVEMHYDSDHNLTSTYTIIDNDKWLIFVLRYFTGGSNG